MYFDDKDFEQKVRMQKILWNMGNWSRIEIPIVIYEDDNKNRTLQKHYLTDIDVYGEIIQSDFSLKKSIGDCKSGKNVKIFERVFWLKGVKEYLSAEQAYLVKKNISSKAKIFLPKVDIVGIDSDTLTEFEKIYHTSDLNLFNYDYYKAKVEIIMQLNEEFKKIFDYMNSRYWFTDLNISMRVLMTMLKKNDFYTKFDKKNKIHKFLILEICIMLTRSIIDCCKYALSRDVINLDVSVIEYIHGGVDGYNNKMQMVREIKHYVQDLFGNKDVANSILVTPEYYKDLLKLIIELIGEAYNANDVIRYLEIMQHEVILEKEINYKEVTGLLYSSVGHKLSKDIVQFYLKHNDIDKGFFDDYIFK